MEQVSPQLEQGYVRIANELFDAIVYYPFSGAEMKVILYVIRKTYGWNRKAAAMAIKAMADSCGIDARYAKRIIKRLVSDRVLIKERGFRNNILGINKNYTQWRLWIIINDEYKKTPQSVLEDTQNSGQQDTHKRQERQNNKDNRVSTVDNSYRKCLKDPALIRTILRM